MHINDETQRFKDQQYQCIYRVQKTQKYEVKISFVEKLLTLKATKLSDFIVHCLTLFGNKLRQSPLHQFKLFYSNIRLLQYS